MCGCPSCAPYWGPGPQPRHVPLLGIKPVTFCFSAHTQSTEPHQPGLMYSYNAIKDDKCVGKLMENSILTHLPLLKKSTAHCHY